MSYAQEETTNQRTTQSHHSPSTASKHISSNGIAMKETTQEISSKVKIYYTWKGSETTCLASFPYQITSTDSNLVQVPLRQCVMCVCTSCPDMLLRPDSDSAVYTANFEEVDHKPTSTDENIVWEGHGLMSWILNDNNHTESSVMARLTKPNEDHDAYIAEVLLQLHPTHRITKTDFYHSLTRGRNQNESTITLPRPQNPWNSPAYDSGSSGYRSEIPQPQSAPSASQSAHFSPRPMSISRLPGSSPSAQAANSSQENEFDSFISRRRLGGNRFGTPTRKLSDEGPSDGPITRLPPIRPIPVREDISSTPNRSYYQDERPKDYEQSGEHSKRRRLSPPSTHTVKGGAFTPINPTRHVTPSVPSPPLESTYAQSESPDATTPNHQTTLAASNRQMPRFRRKKRDTKPPNNDVRSVVDVAKDESGKYILPVEVDSWTVYDLGKVVWDRPAFHNQRYIYPVGYRVKKWYRSMVDPLNDTQYTCEILDGGKEPIFRLQADDNMDEVFTGPTCTTVWTIAVRRAFAVRNMEYGHNPVGPDFFGLRKNTIAKMIQDLPNAEKCTNYIWQNFEVGKTNKTVRSFLPDNEPSPFSGPERPTSVQNDSDDPPRNGESTPTLSARKPGRPVHAVYEHTT
ncbi:hypothetical protein BC943DRAFT_327303 [Umbelopsis sp. AD052]|nr:hypothetical protein BC943DRAFT_327303 [Umbelopsis sp. AD052]